MVTQQIAAEEDCGVEALYLRLRRYSLELQVVECQNYTLQVTRCRVQKLRVKSFRVQKLQV
jgi:hypothetical protein